MRRFTGSLAIIIALYCLTLAKPAPAKLATGPGIMPIPIYELKTNATISLPRSQSTDTWIVVPEWLAGTWSANRQTLLYCYSHHLHTYVVSEPEILTIDRVTTIGMQTDAHGQRWHYTGTPYVRNCLTPSYRECHTIKEIHVIQRTSQSLTVRSLAVVTQFERRTNTPLNEFLEESITTYQPITPGTIKVSFIINDYDLLGTPLTSSACVCVEKRTKPFHRIDVDDRGNLRQNFIDHIRSTPIR